MRKGIREAENEAAVQTWLRGQNLTPIRVGPKKKAFDFNNISFGSGVSTQDIVKFTRQFATMIDAGLPLVQCLDIQ
ncbi:MAG TPA: type II secretion system F family protein, partial [Polyangium sp.]|nr:type II secretion system F family protein [Polyangium sp.]